MANNTQLPSGTGGDTIRDIDRSGVKTPISLLDVGGTASEALIGDTGVAMPTKHAAGAEVDGHSLTLGATADSAATTDTGTFSLVSLTKRLLQKLSSQLPASAAALQDAASNPTTPMVGGALLIWNGASWDRLRGANAFKDLSAVTITSITTVWTPASGKKYRLLGGCISVSAAASVLFEDNAAGGGSYVCRTPKLAADTPYNFVLGNGNGYLSPTADHVLKATASAAAAITGFLFGCEE